MKEGGYRTMKTGIYLIVMAVVLFGVSIPSMIGLADGRGLGLVGIGFPLFFGGFSLYQGINRLKSKLKGV